MTTMTQCRLERPEGHSTAVQIAWIDSEFAKRGKIVKIKTGDEWDDGWKVVKVGSTQDAKIVADRERDFKKHRSATDV